LIYLSDTIIANNTSKRIFVFTHHFFTNKAGNNNNYHPGGSTCLMGLTLHFLNWINDNNENVFFFTGHSHLSWLDTTTDLHWTNKKYGYKEPTSAENTAISDNNTWNTAGTHYYHNMWKVKANDDTSTTIYNPYYKTSSAGEGGWNIHLPSMSRPVYNGSNQESACEAAILRVYDNGIIIEKIGYTTNDGGLTYIPYSSISDKTLTVYNSNNSGGGSSSETINIISSEPAETSVSSIMHAEHPPGNALTSNSYTNVYLGYIESGASAYNDTPVVYGVYVKSDGVANMLSSVSIVPSSTSGHSYDIFGDIMTNNIAS
jgi:hypothetical protein